MKSYFITFRSVTPAQRGENALRREGIDCTLQRTPGFMQEQGCGYSLTVRRQDILKCVQVMRNSRIPFQKVYLRRENGSFEELTV